MSESSVLTDQHGQPIGTHRKRGGGLRSCLPILVVVLLFCLVAGYFGLKAVDEVRGWFGGPEDYPGPGTGEVLVTVDPGQTVTSIGEELEELGVVASSEAFVDAAAVEERANTIQAGTYLLKEEMKASDALAVLLDPGNMAQTTITVPEGLRVVDVVDLLAENTDFRKKQYEKVLARPEALRLPEWAQLNPDGLPEGYLFPATYTITPTDTPKTILRSMVDRWRQAAEDVGLEQAAADLGYTPHELMTVASLVEAEGRGDDMPKVARVIYNRLEDPTAETAGFLQLDATVNYAHGRNLGARTTSEDREIDSPYNTYVSQGLPPGPIEAPGQEAMEAAAHPAEGDWLYYVTVNLETGETKFAETLAEHQALVEELDEYCRNESERC